MTIATTHEAINEWAANVGYEDCYKDRAWILSNYDTWERNPYYTGPEQLHPEEEAEMAAQEAERIHWQNSKGDDMVYLTPFSWLDFNRFDAFAGCRASGCVVEAPTEVPF